MHGRKTSTTGRNMPLQALFIRYAAGDAPENRKKRAKNCHADFDIAIRLEKPLQIYVIMPLITELQRTMNAAFKDEEFDLAFWKKKLANSLQLQRTLEMYNKYKEQAIEQVKKGEQHISVPIEFEMGAPVLRIPFQENVFERDGPHYLELDMGILTVTSQLQQDLINKKQGEDHSKDNNK